MYGKLARIEISDQQYLEKGVGQAIFDCEKKPTKRYFLEKRWKEEGPIFGAVLMNPSHARAIESDDTVDSVIKYAKAQGYAALYLVNILALIEPDSNSLPDNIVQDDIQKKCLKFTLESSTTILIGWGGKGHKHFLFLLEDDEVRESFFNNRNKCRVFRFGKDNKFPMHPRPNNSSKYDFKSNSELINIGETLNEWIVGYNEGQDEPN